MTSISSTITNMTNVTAAKNTDSTSTENSKTLLDQNAFLQLMIAQLKNQDPTNPADTNQMLEQEAMITQTGYLQNINETMSTLNSSISNISGSSATSSLLQASNLIGKEITATDPNNENSTISGTVSAVTYNSDDVTLTIGDHTVSLDNVQSVQNASN